MDCVKNNKNGAEIVTGYCAGTLDPSVAREIGAHIGECAECRGEVEAQRAVWDALDAWTPVAVSGDFDARLYARIAQEQAGPAWRRWLRRTFQPAAPMVWWKAGVSLAAAGAALSLALLIGHLPNRTDVIEQKATVVKSVPASDDVDLQQVQQALDDLDILTPASQSPSSKL